MLFIFLLFTVVCHFLCDGYRHTWAPGGRCRRCCCLLSLLLVVLLFLFVLLSGPLGSVGGGFGVFPFWDWVPKSNKKILAFSD